MRKASRIIVALGLLASGSLAFGDERAVVEAWYTFSVNTPEEALFLDAVAAFEAAHPDIDVNAVRIPYLQNLAQFINSSQGGEAPDLLRVSDTELGKLGHISVEGLPLLEDLRPHLTPMQRSVVEPRALAALRYGDPLYALPASQGGLTLLYNKALFEAAGVAFPTDDWTTDDLIAAGRALTRGNVSGIALPLRWSYWYVPFQAGFGGAPFDADGRPTLDSPGSAEALDFFLDFDREHGIVTSTAGLEAMSTAFQVGNAAMVFDGSWNLANYRGAGIDVGLALLPTVAETGRRLGPVSSYFGWAVSKQSAVKEEAVLLARWLTSAELQKSFALETGIVPVDRSLAEDPEILADPVISAYLRQAEFGLIVPTNQGAAAIYEQFDTALQLVQKGELDARTALKNANEQMEQVMAR